MYYSSATAIFAENPRTRRISTFMKTKQRILYLAYTFCRIKTGRKRYNGCIGYEFSDFIITEGAAYTPKIIKKYGIQEYITIIPTLEFQITHYKEREYVPYVLEGCSDK